MKENTSERGGERDGCDEMKEGGSESKDWQGGKSTVKQRYDTMKN